MKIELKFLLLLTFFFSIVVASNKKVGKIKGKFYDPQNERIKGVSDDLSEESPY